ncbi:MAG TPA: NTP transferase domain-containing protein, partial [Magnetococcales bacterium]|nr:NTP transferase domain-containing protein [Magnetococcales bacterium]
VPVAFAFLGECSIVVDERQPRQGPLAGLEAALKVITTDWLLSVPVDVPFFPLNLAQRFFEAVGNTRQPAIAMNRGRTHPVVALWPRDILNKISQALDNNDRGLNYFLRHTPHCEVAFPDDKNGVDPFFNINTQQDLEQAEQWLIHWLGR